MRILMVIPCYLPAHRYGGPVKSTHEMARALVKDGVSVTVFTTNANGEEDLEVPTNSEVDMDGVRVWYFQVDKPRSYFRSTGLLGAVRARLREFDLVHINWLYVYPTLFTARECTRQKVPYILSPRGMLDSGAIAMKGRLKKLIYLHLLERQTLMRSELIHFTSKGELEHAYSARWKVRSEVVHLGLDLSPYNGDADLRPLLERFPVLDGKQLVLFLGRLNYIKGLDLLARAWPCVMASNPNAHLVIAGPDEDGNEMRVRSWLDEGGVRGTCTFTGMLLGNDKLAALHGATVCVVPSYLESFGMTIVEAMACGTPVVITDRVNICREVEAAKAGLIVPCNAERIADAICAILKDPKAASDTGLNGRKLVEEKFAIGSAAYDMRDLYQKILRRRHDERRSIAVQ
jgi:glycosyltransferase involved in cell wall biosynthesis